MKTVCITGVSRGLGKELFQLFAAKKYLVYGIVRSETSIAAQKDDLPSNAKYIVADLASDTSIETLQKSIQDSPIDLLINNAGIAGSAYQLDHVHSQEVIGLFNIHCLGVFRTFKALKGNLLKSKKPIVINLNSRLGSITRQSKGIYDHLTISYSYRIAKAAQNMLTNAIRSEFKESIQFISLHPGKMQTEIAASDANLNPKEVAEKILLAYENQNLKEENGILELGSEVIEW